jgi:adenylate cyclase
LKLYQALELLYRQTKKDNLQAQQLADDALALDPNYAMAYCVLAFAYTLSVWQGWSESLDESLSRAEELVKKAISLDDSLFFAHSVFSNVLAVTGRHGQAILEGDRGVTLAPNSSAAYGMYAYTIGLAGRHNEAIRLTEYALRLDPFPPMIYLSNMAGCYLSEGMYEKAIEVCEKAIRLYPANAIAHLHLVAIYSWMSLEDKARDEMMEVMRINPMFSLDNYEKSFVPLFKDKTVPGRYIEALRKVWPR